MGGCDRAAQEGGCFGSNRGSGPGTVQLSGARGGCLEPTAKTEPSGLGLGKQRAGGASISVGGTRMWLGKCG